MSHSAAGEPPTAARRVAPVPLDGYSASEWELLIRLPARVIVAATRAEPGRPSRGVGEGLAGLAGVAAGRGHDSDLVRAVVAAIYAQPDDGRPDGVPALDRVHGLMGLLTSCRDAARLLADRADPADSAAYRQWLQSVAARVCRAGRTEPPAAAGPPVDTAARRRFLELLGEALGLR
ncbi:hypothetical protein AB0J86_28475 [Micromonospora sp. NPDC049559]|uniref:hypothetical protein n=1 Tax=Micromonospora sp. NPDC049559 TaxID=3155923 RepID=UPI00341A2975